MGKELPEGIENFLKQLSTHNKFKEIFGEFTFGDTDLNTNLAFIKSVIVAREVLDDQRNGSNSDDVAAVPKRMVSYFGTDKKRLYTLKEEGKRN